MSDGRADDAVGVGVSGAACRMRASVHAEIIAVEQAMLAGFEALERRRDGLVAEQLGALRAELMEEIGRRDDRVADFLDQLDGIVGTFRESLQELRQEW